MPRVLRALARGQLPEVEFIGSQQDCEMVANAFISAVPNYVTNDDIEVWIADDEEETPEPSVYVCQFCIYGHVLLIAHHPCNDPDCVCELHNDGLNGYPDDDYYQ